MSNKWCFTSWQKPVCNLKLCEYIIWQKEYCPSTGLSHYQGYVEFVKSYNTLGPIKRIFKQKTMHVEVAKHNKQVNFLYCTKNQSFAGERFEYGAIETGIQIEWDDYSNN